MDIRICKRYEVPSVAHEFKATHILSLIDPGAEVFTPTFCEGNHRIIHFFDEDHESALGAPTLKDIQEAIDWARTVPTTARLIVHCEGGCSRSTAMALGIWALENHPGKSLQEGAKWLREIRPIACPNLLIAKFIDQILELNGEFVKVADEVCEFRMIDLAHEWHTE